jgi:hypothetical protein
VLRWRPGPVAGCLLSCFILWSSPGEAACGIESCPAYRAAVKKDASFHTGLRLKYADFQLFGTKGQYLQYIPRFEYRGLANFVFGLQAPVTTLLRNDDIETGLSNPVMFGEWKWQPQSALSFQLGLQIELPVGNTELGIADSHLEILPYAGALFGMDSYFTKLTFGFRQSIDAHESEASDESSHDHMHLIVVNPHTSQEVTYRVNVGRRLFRDRLMASVYLDVVQELEQAANDVPVMRAGIDAQLELSLAWDARFRFDRGISTNRRTESRGEISIQFRW